MAPAKRKAVQSADRAAVFCEEVTDEEIAENISSQQTAVLCDGSNGSSDSYDEVDTALPSTPMTTQIALAKIESLVDFMHAKRLPPVHAQQLEATHAAIMKI